MADIAPLDVLAKSSGWLIAYGVILIVLGMMAIGAPLMAGFAIETLVGAFVLAAGIVQIVHAFRARSWGIGFLAFGGGVLAIVCGLLLLAHPLLGLSFLTLLLAAFFLVDGVYRVAYAFHTRPLAGWGWALFGGLVSLLLAVMIYGQWPLSGAWAVGLLVGINILFTGWAAVAAGLALRAHRTGA